MHNVIYVFFLNNLENMIKKVQLHRKKGYTESSLNKCIVWQSFHFHYFFTKFVLFHSLKKQIKMLMITKKNEHNQNKAFSLSQELLSQLLNAFFFCCCCCCCFCVFWPISHMLCCLPLFNKWSWKQVQIKTKNPKTIKKFRKKCHRVASCHHSNNIQLFRWSIFENHLAK